MNTYLGFKRVVTDKVTGLQTSETKFVPVDIPQLKAEDGWKLIGSSDTVEVIPMLSGIQINGCPISAEQLPEEQLTIVGMEPDVEKPKKELPNGSSFDSPVSGTAKLIRANNDVFIAYRRGKKGLNETSPNSVCISETTKAQFFADCRRAFGRSCDQYRFSSGCKEFDYWNKFMDEEYARQLKEFNRVHT